MIGYGGSSSLAVDDIRSDYLSSFGDNQLELSTLKESVKWHRVLVEIDEQRFFCELHCKWLNTNSRYTYFC
jgi:hypothetical protein